MLDNNLFDLKSDSKKSSVGYTIDLDYFGDAYIFYSPYGNIENDLRTYVHEFGHYVNSAHDATSIFGKTFYIDVCEIHSQGMEGLISQEYKNIYGEELGDKLEKSEMYDVISAVSNACMVAEFEIYAYEHEGASVDELAEYYAKLAAGYGNAYVEGGNYLFVNISHIYQSPMYYISYATSALSAVEIYNLSKKDPELAREKYLELSALGSGWRYKGVTEFVGLENIFKKGTISHIYNEFYNNIKD